jgi:predicted SAM-dependent methyltransferase
MNEIKLNVGCAENLEDVNDGWINIDLNPESYPQCHGILPADALLLPFKDNVFSLVKASHLLEHFVLPEVFIALAEWLRVLKTEGTLVVIVPDMTEICKRWVKSTFLGKLNWWNPAMFGSHRGPGQVHFCGLDRDMLELGFKKVGFKNIKSKYSHEFWVETRGTK